ncbi:MAG: tetratricopeptide repeat protein [Desulfomonilaceae bacterium]
MNTISPRAIKLYACLLLFFVVGMTFLPCVRNDFVNWDDLSFVVRNGHISSLSVKSFLWMLTTFYQGAWHPLTWLSHGLDRALWGLSPSAHHLVNVIIHALNAVLVCVLFTMLQEVGLVKSAKRALDQTPLQTRVPPPEPAPTSVYLGAFAAAFLFAVHPLRVESVAWISERKDVLCTFFFLGSLITYLKYACAEDFYKKRRYYLLTLALEFLALLSKPMAVTLPLVFVLFDFFPLARITRSSFGRLIWEKIPFLLLCLGTVVANLVATWVYAESFISVPASIRIMNAFYGIVFYLCKTVFPSNLVPFYHLNVSLNYFGPRFVISALLVLVGTAIVVWRALNQDRLWAAVWFYYLITLAPTLGFLMSHHHAIANRYTYLTTLSFWFLIALGFSRVWDRAGKLRNPIWMKTTAVGAVAIVGLVCVYITQEQISIWRNSKTLWSYVIEHADYVPAVAFFGFGRELERQGALKQALEYYNVANSLNPSNSQFRNQIGEVLVKLGDLESALKVFTENRDKHSNWPFAHFQVGRTLVLLKRYDEAAACLERALELEPNSLDSLLWLTQLCLAKGDKPGAETSYRKYLRLRGAPVPQVEHTLGIDSGNQER